MNKKKRPTTLDRISLSNPQRLAVAQLLAGQKNKYKKMLHESHERLHTITDSVSSVELWISVNGVVEFVSPSFQKMFGYPAAQVEQKTISFSHVCHPDDLPRLRADLGAVMEGATLSAASYRFLHKNGSIIWVSATWNVVRTRRDKIVGVRLGLIDVTSSILCKDLLAMLGNGLLEYGRDRSDLPACAVNTDAEVRYWNAGAESAFGWSEADVLGAPVSSVLSETSRETFAALFPNDSHEPVSFPVKVLHKSGSTRDARLALHVIPGTGQKESTILCVFQFD